MVKGQYKKYNEMLSTLAYAKFSQIIESNCARNRIYLKKVNLASGLLKTSNKNLV